MILKVLFPLFITCGFIYIANSMSSCSEESDQANEAIDDMWRSYIPSCEKTLDYKLNITENKLMVIISFQ
jgi:hypothetical protein